MADKHFIGEAWDKAWKPIRPYVTTALSIGMAGLFGGAALGASCRGYEIYNKIKYAEVLLDEETIEFTEKSLEEKVAEPVAVPIPQPVAEPAPIPQPEYQPKPQPAPIPQPEYQPKPQPATVAKSIPQPAPRPAPATESGLACLDQSKVETYILRSVNGLRRDAKIGFLKRGDSLNKRAHAQNIERARNDQGGLGRIVGYDSNPQGAADAFFTAWNGNDGRKANILNPDYTEIGVDVCKKEDHYYATLKFK